MSASKNRNARHSRSPNSGSPHRKRRSKAQLMRMLHTLPPNPDRDKRMLAIDPASAYFRLNHELEYYEADESTGRFSVAIAAKLLNVAQADVRDLIAAGIIPTVSPVGDEVQRRIRAEALAAFIRHLWIDFAPDLTSREVEEQIQGIRDFKRALEESENAFHRRAFRKARA